jgi:hypothetical protein
MSKSVIGALMVSLGLDSAQFTKGAKEAQTTMQRMGQTMRRVGAGMSAIGTGLAFAVRGQLTAVDDMGKAAQAMGVPIEQLSQLKHAADMSGASFETLGTGLRRLSRSMVDGSDAFAQIGVSATNADGSLRPTMDVLADVSDALSRMPDGAEKTALAMELFGRSGTELIPMLNGGSSALHDMMREAEALGLTISRDTFRAAETFNDNLARLQGLAAGATATLTAGLAPILARITDALVAASRMFQSLSPEVQKVITVMGGLVLIVGPLLVVMGLLVAAIGTISAPVLAAVAALTTLGGLLAAFWPDLVKAKDAAVAFVNEGLSRIGAAMDSAATAMRDGIDRGVAFVKQSFADLLAYLQALPQQFMQMGRDIIQGLADGITERWEAVKARVTGVGDSIKDGFRELFQIRSPSRVFHEMGGFLMQGLGNGITETADQPISATKAAGQEISGAMDATARRIDQTFENAFVSLVTGAKSARQVVGDILNELARMLAQSAFRSFFGGGGKDPGFFGEALGAFFDGPSFDGGGFTGNGSRVGGLDGKGGFLAMLHPRETVVDHTRTGGAMGRAMEIVVNVAGARGNAEIEEMVTAGVTQGLRAYDRQILPSSIRRVTSDGRRIG